MLKIYLLTLLTVSCTALANSYVRPIEHAPGSFQLEGMISETEAFILNQVFETLFEHNKQGAIVGRIAQKWDFNPTFDTLKVSIHPKVYFNDGTVLTTKDIVWSFKENFSRILHPLIKEIIVRDIHNIEFRCNRACPNLLSDLSDVPYYIWKSTTNIHNFIGTGAYKYTKNSKITLEENTFYKGARFIKRIELPLLSKKEAVKQFKENKVDDLFHFYLSKEDRSQLGDKCNWTYLLLPSFRMLGLKSYKPYLNTPEKRSCVFAQIDRLKLATAWSEPYLLMNHWLPRQALGGEALASAFTFKCDPILLEETKKSSKSNPIQIPSIPSVESYVEQIGNQLKAASISYKIVKLEDIPEYLNILQAKSIDLFMFRFTPTRPEVDSFLDPFLDKKSGIDFNFANLDIFRKNTEQILKINDRSVKAHQLSILFKKLFSQNRMLPIHQFEFSGCLAKKWSAPDLPLTGFISQRISELVPIK